LCSRTNFHLLQTMTSCDDACIEFFHQVGHELREASSGQCCCNSCIDSA
jgi:hypothetical protein